MTFDFETEQAAAEWLTDILMANGYLEAGYVTKVGQQIADVDAGASAKIYAITLEYSAESIGVRPNSFLMKVAKSGSVEAFEERSERYAAWLLLPQEHRYATLHKEPIFYESVRGTKNPLPLIPCYGSETDLVSHNTCLLLEDYSKTHVQPPWPVPPLQKHCENTIDALAQLHAHWWNSRDFGTAAFPLISADQIDEIVAVYQKCYLQFGDLLGDRLSDTRRSIYEDVLLELPRLLKARFTASNKLTLSHGDAHHWNMLLPLSGDDVVIFDWQTWHVDTGAHDLAYLMGVLWYAEHRNHQEKPLLDRYRVALIALGIEYESDDLAFDYKLSIIRHLFTPVIFSSFVMPAVWWPQLDRIFCTFDDWNCDELLQR